MQIASRMSTWGKGDVNNFVAFRKTASASTECPLSTVVGNIARKNFTFSTWFRLESWHEWLGMFQVETGNGLSDNWTNATSVGFTIQGVARMTTTSIPTSNLWHHYCFTISQNGQSWEFYLDGALANTYTISRSWTSGGYGGLYLMRYGAGALCKPCIWQTHFSATDAQNDYLSRGKFLYRDTEIVTCYPQGVQNGVIVDTFGGRNISSALYENINEVPWA